MADANSTVLSNQHPLHNFALEATWQISHLSLLASKALDESTDPLVCAAQSLIDRIKAVNYLLMSSLDEDIDPEWFAHGLGVPLSECHEVKS